MKYHFRIWLEGEGGSKKDAWLNALSRFLKNVEGPPAPEHPPTFDTKISVLPKRSGNYFIREEEP